MNRAAARQLTVSYLAVNALVFVLSRRAAMAYSLHELIGVVFLAGALLSIRRDDDDTGRYGVRLAGLFPGHLGDPRSLVRTVWEAIPSALRELSVAGAVALVVLPVYSLAWPWFNRPVGVRHFDLGAHWRDVATQVVAVAFTEELYFRGYVFTRVADALGVGPAPGSQGTVPWPTALRPVVLTAVLFALTHVVVEPTLPRVVVFFPALLFGLLRARRGGIGAAVALHALSNLWETWLEGRFDHFQ